MTGRAPSSPSALPPRAGGASSLAQAVALALAALLCPAPASAQGPSFWEECLDPSLARVRPLLQAIRGTLALGEGSRDGYVVALGLADRARRLRPRDPEILQLRGELLYRLGQWGEAARELAAAEALDPDGPLAYSIAFDLGVALTRLERFDEAAEAYRRFLDEAPWPRERATALTNLAETLMAEGRLEEAVAEYRAALATDPRYSYGFLGLAVALDRMGDEVESRSAVLAALSTGAGIDDLDDPAVFFVPAWEHHYYRALALEAAGRLEEARAEWRSFLDEGGAAGPYAARVREHLAALSSPRSGPIR